MKREILAGKTDYSALVFIPDPASTDGSGKTGLVAANLTVSGTRMETDNDATVIDYTSSLNDLAALTTAHTDWGLKEISSTLAPGLYRLDIADALFASGAWTAVVYVMITTSAAAASPMEFVIVAHDPDGAIADIQTRLPAALVSGRMDSTAIISTSGITAGSFSNGAIDAAALNADAGTEIGTAVWATTTRLLTAGTNIVLAKGVGVTGFNDLSAADVNAEVDTALADYDGPTNAEMVARTLAAADYATAAAQTTAQGTLTKLETTWVLDGAVYQFTANALELGPSGSGLDAAGVRAAIGLGSANLDTQLADLPTVAEFNARTIVSASYALATQLGTNGDALSAIPWNAAWDAEVQSEAADALNAYDPPTNAEMVSRTLLAADYATATVLGAVPTTAQIADKILTRHIAGGSDVSGSEARNVMNALRALRNRQAIAAGTGTVYEEDDITAAWTYAATTTAGNPLSEINPT